MPTGGRAFFVCRSSVYANQSNSGVLERVVMALVRPSVLFVAFTLSVSLSTMVQVDSNRGAQDTGMDRSVRPGDDFYRYANGNWLKAGMSAGQIGTDTRAMLVKKTNQRVRGLIEEAAANPKPGVIQKVGDYYASYLDEQGIEAQGLTPLAPELAAISAIEDRKSLSAYLGSTLNSETDGLTENADHIFGAWVNQSFTESDHYVFHLLQGGLGMPDREAYLDPSPEKAALRDEYKGHIAAMLRFATVADPDVKAARILSLEIRIAQSHAPDVDAADVFKQNNPWKRADFSAKAPGMDWDAYFTAAGVANESEFIVWQPCAVSGTASLVRSEDIDVWKDYLRFHLLEHYASVLPKAVAAEHFRFFGKILSGKEQMPDRTDDAIRRTNAALGQPVGQLYTQRYFPPETKSKVQEMVLHLIAAYRARISNLKWMSQTTREKALKKLDALKIGVGYPDTWIDYSPLDVVRGDAFGNMRRAEAFNRSLNIAKLKRPVDPDEWRIDPQIVGAVIVFSPNTETFSAGILQPPFFDSNGDAASNYGSAGAGIAHEISHSFDELGNIYDAEGRLGNWWAAKDSANYRSAARKLAAQFDAYCPFSDLCVSGEKVLRENIADLAGLLTAHDAYELSLKGKPDVVINGLTGDQRFFIAFAQRWRKVQDEGAIRRQIKSDTHAPGEYRSDTVRNVDAWYKAFGISPGDKLYLKPEDRPKIW